MAVKDCDVLVIGGGPAGSTVASRLAQLGHDVVLVDRGRTADRIETLAPGTLDLLAVTGAAEHVTAARFERVTASVVDWGRGQGVRAAAGDALLVDRARFDRLLRDHAVQLGVDVVRPGVVRRSDGSNVVDVATPGGPCSVRARFVVDAGGRRRAGAGSTATPMVALGARVTGPVVRSPSVHARAHAWFWCAPAPGGCQVTAFVDAIGGTAGPAPTPTDRLRALVHDARLFEPHTWRIAGRVRAVDATPTLSRVVASGTSLRVGDAAVALDPLSSTGVQKAVQSALSAAVVINTVLRRPLDAEAALDHHRRSVLTTSRHHALWTAETYAAGADVFGTAFWWARAFGRGAMAGMESATSEVAAIPPPAPDRCVRVSLLASIVDTTRLDGEFVTTGPAVRHPGLDGAVAYVGGVALAPLLRSVTAPAPLADLVQAWSSEVEPAIAARLAGWLYRRGVLEVVDAA